MVKGFFNQHWAGTNAVGDTIRFDPFPSDGLAYGYGNPILLTDMSYFQTANSILPVSGTTTEITMSVWIRPQVTTTSGNQTHYIFKVSEQVNDDYAYLSITKPSGYTNVAYVNLKFGGVDVTFTPQRLINFDQWNHILFSVKNKGATFTFGHQSGGVEEGGKLVKNAGTHRGDRAHLVINGTAFHRYAEPLQSGYTTSDPGGWTTNHGFFRNDFASGSSGASSSFGYYNTNIATDNTDTSDPNYPNNNEGDVITGTADKDTIFGGYYGTATNPQTGVGYFRGEMFQFFLKDQYYDLTNSSNRDLFYDGSSGLPVSSLPSSPSVLFTAGLNGPDNDGTVNVGSIVTNRLSTGSDPS